MQFVEQVVVRCKQRVERRAQIMSHRGEEYSLHFALNLGLLSLADGRIVTHQDQKLVLSFDSHTLEIDSELHWLGKLRKNKWFAS